MTYHGHYQRRSTAVGEKLPNGWIDRQFYQTSWLMLFALTALFSVLMWIFSGAAILMAENEIARKKAKVIFAVCCVYLFVFLPILFYRIHNSENPSSSSPPTRNRTVQTP